MKAFNFQRLCFLVVVLLGVWACWTSGTPQILQASNMIGGGTCFVCDSCTEPYCCNVEDEKCGRTARDCLGDNVGDEEILCDWDAPRCSGGEDCQIHWCYDCW